MNKLIKLFKQLQYITDNKYKSKFYVYIIFSIFISGVEVIGISIIVPLMSIISDKTVIHSNTYYNFFYTLFDFDNSLNFIVSFGVVIVLFFLIRTILNLIYIYKLNEFSSKISSYVSTKLFTKYISMKYLTFTEQNISHMTKTSINESANISYMIVGLLQLVSEVTLAILIYILLLIINWKVTLIISVLLVILGVLFYIVFIKRTKVEGYKRANSLKTMYSILNSSLNNFKTIKIISNEKELINNYKKETLVFADANTIHLSYGAFPRFILECISFVLFIISILLLLIFNQGDIQQYVSIIFLFLLALYRLLPAVNKILGNINNIQYLSPILKDVMADINLNLEIIGNDDLSFDKKITIDKLSFTFGEKIVFSDISLDISKNDKIALIGESGVGKSTLINLLLGFLEDYDGKIYIDNTILSSDNLLSFRKKIGYIPQDIYLFDGTVSDNISFGREYSEQKVVEALKKANIYDVLLEKDGINTKVGDSGIKLSGGQKQRVGIARALYNDPEIIIMDEGTSALDVNVEKKIMDEIFNISKNKTLIIITHRIDSIKDCNKIFELKNGKIKNVKDNKK